MIIEETVYKDLLKAIQDRYQLDFSGYAQSSFQRRIERFMAVHNIDHVELLIQRITDKQIAHQQFLDEITVNTTELFRDPTCWISLTKNVIEKLSHKSTIRIWHAGCSTGEEVASMVILLDQLGLIEQTRIFATDIDETVIARAKKFSVRKRNYDLYLQNYKQQQLAHPLSDYFDEADDTYVLKPHLFRNVMFKKHNLALDQEFSKFDLIMCRNVFIYFNHALQELVLEKFIESMFRNSYLCIGSKESIGFSKLSDRFLNIDRHERIFQLK